jgi:hypothetical protein
MQLQTTPNTLSARIEAGILRKRPAGSKALFAYLVLLRLTEGWKYDSGKL